MKTQQKSKQSAIWFNFPPNPEYHFKIRPISVEEINNRDPEADTLTVIAELLEDWQGIPPVGTPCTNINKRAFLTLNGESTLYFGQGEKGEAQMLNLYSWIFYSSIILENTGGIWIPPPNLKPIFNPHRFRPVDIKASHSFKSNMLTILPIPDKNSTSFPTLVTVSKSKIED